MKNKTNCLNILFVISHTHHSLQWEWFLKSLKQHANIYFIILSNDKNLKKVSLFNNLKNIGLNVELYSVRNFISYIRIIYKLISNILKYNIDIVQTEMPHGNFLGLLAAFITGKKRVMTASNVTWYQDFNSKKQYIIDKFSYKIANCIICQATSSIKTITSNFKIPTKKILVINHAIDPNEYDSVNKDQINQLKKKYEIKANDFVFGMVARLEYWKGHEYAIKATKLIVDKFPKIKLLIFGEGPEKGNLLRLIKSLNLEDKVYLCGFEKNILPLYYLFDVQIHVPIDENCETFGITILDGMMTQRPLILTLSGIASEIAKHNYNAYVVNYKNEKDLSEAMEKLIESSDLRETLGKNARETVLNRFSISEKLNKHLDLYQKLLN